MKKIIKKETSLSQSKTGKYSGRLSDALALGNHESFRIADNFYRLLVESLSGYGIFTTDKEGNISSWNGGAQKLFGYKEDEIIGVNASIFFKQEDIDKLKLQKELKRAALKGKVVIDQFHLHKNGSQFWASGLIFSLGDEDDVSRGFTFIVRDLTENMEFEKRKDAFIGTATHELRTPITSLKLYAQIVELEIKKSKNTVVIKAVGELNKQLDRIMALMDYLLDVSKIQKEKLALKKTSFDMNVLIDEIIDTVQIISKDHQIVSVGNNLGEVYGDRERLGQVLANLLTNAVKYSPGPNRVAVVGKNNTVAVVISVQDFGLGIDKTEQASIFSRFYRASNAIKNKIDGIGLGLYVAQQIVKAHGGKMWLESEKGQGSTFYFSIPSKS